MSDSTIRLAGLHSLLGAVYAAGRAVGLGRCQVGGGRWRIGVIDGSSFGRFMASRFAEIGSVCLMGGLEAIPKFGKELPSSQRLLRRLLARFGPRWVDLLLLDGLYVAQGFLRVCLQEAGLDIIQDAMGLFRNYRAYAHDIEYVQGTDAQRMVSYRVYALGAFFLQGVVSWVQEEDLRSGKQVMFPISRPLYVAKGGRILSSGWLAGCPKKMPKKDVMGNFWVDGIEVDWAVEDISEEEFLAKYRTNSYTRRTDDVVWLWCAGDLFERCGSPDDWRWVYETGKECFQRLYDPFFDAEDGLYRGQASFIDIHYEDSKATGYPSEWTVSDCVHIKATSTNCLYVKGLEVMGVAARKLGLADEAASWASRARSLKEAIRRELRFEDGTFAYFKDRSGRLEDRRDALGTALAVLLEVVTGEEAVEVLRDYPVTDAGVPLFHPFYPVDNWYHNNSSWPFVDTLFLMASEKTDGKDRTSLNLALLARVCRGGTFHEVVDLRDKEVRGSGGQLWTAAAFLGTCMRAGFELGRRS